MDETYTRQLDGLAGALPPGPCRIALVPTIPATDAAALASDLAQVIGRGRSGHTLLFSFEPGPGRLDHEVGVEDAGGLVDVLAGRVRLADIAAHGKARGFIYVPAGKGANPGAALLGSAAWRALSGSAVRRGGTVLAFLPREVHDDAPSGAKSLFDLQVWLGPPGPAAAWPVAGAVDLPGRSVAAPQAPVDRDAGPPPLRLALSERMGPADEGSRWGRVSRHRPGRLRHRVRGALDRHRKTFTTVLLILTYATAIWLIVLAIRASEPWNLFSDEEDSTWAAPRYPFPENP